MSDLEQPLLLYVDDEWSNRVVFEQTFSARFRLKAVGSGAEALTILKSEPVAVLVTDQRMPDMSGNELLVHSKTLCPETVRVVITAYSDLDPILRAVNEGLVARYLIKPWDSGELERILSWGIEAYTLGRDGSALQLRLMQTERLVTLGSIAAAVLHDLAQPLAFLHENSKRLADLASASTRLAELVRVYQSTLPPDDALALLDLAAELPDISRDMVIGCNLMVGISQSMRRLLRPPVMEEAPAAEPYPIIQYAIAVCRESAMRAQGRVLYEGPEVLPRVRIGATELTQVLINLVANGTQAILRRSARGGRVVVSAVDLGPHLQLRVVDDGPGMSPETLAKVGTPFFTTREEGTGLGVAQCRRLVAGVRGELTIESNEGVGTIVTVSLARV